MAREEVFTFAPYPGLTIDGIAGEQPLRVETVTYTIADEISPILRESFARFKVRLAWLSPDPLPEADLLKLGWHAVVLS